MSLLTTVGCPRDVLVLLSKICGTGLEIDGNSPESQSMLVCRCFLVLILIFFTFQTLKSLQSHY